jgi:hypothetical protein
MPWTPGWKRNYRLERTRTEHPAAFPRVAARHASGRFVVLYQPGLADHVDLRIYDRYRRYVPRRLRVPIVNFQHVLDAESPDAAYPLEPRVRRPLLFPGAAHDVVSLATGLRGRVLSDRRPVRWVRVEAFLDGPAAPLLARAQGDDRGEFLLLLPPEASTVSVLADPIPVRLRVYGPQTLPVPSTPELPARDPYWDLPWEVCPPPGEPDTVSSGVRLPMGYVEGATRVVDFWLGRLRTASDHVAHFEFHPL